MGDVNERPGRFFFGTCDGEVRSLVETLREAGVSRFKNEKVEVELLPAAPAREEQARAEESEPKPQKVGPDGLTEEMQRLAYRSSIGGR